MDLALQICHYIIWFPLAILVLSAMLRCGIRNYPLIFTYMTVAVLIAVAEMPSTLPVHVAHYTQAQMELHQKLYAIAQGVTHLLIFAAVGSFLLRATEGSEIRRVIRTGVAVGGLAFIAASFLMHYDGTKSIGLWMPPWTRDINFGAAIVDLILWGLLLSARKKNHTLLLLVGGMGISFAGDAICDAVKSIAIHYRSSPLWLCARVFSWFSDAAWLYVWWQAFRRAPATEMAEAGRKAVVSG